MSDLIQIVRRIGGHLYDNGRRALVPGPHHSIKDRSLSLWENHEGRVIFFSHAGDSVASVRAHLGLEAAKAEDELSPAARAKARKERLEAQQAEHNRKLRFCQAAWSRSQPLEGTLGARYLVQAREIPLKVFPPVLRFHAEAPRSYTSDRTSPAILALIQDAEGQACGLHFTYLKRDGSWHDGRIMAGSARGSAVRLHAATDELAVGEGLETMLSYSFLTARPVWALLSTSNFISFKPPLMVDRLYVAPDMDDKNGTSMAFAEAMRERISTARTIIDPPAAGTDWNTHMRRENAA